MLVIKIELWPYGNERQKRTIGTARIANCGDDSYEAIFEAETSHPVRDIWIWPRLEGFNRPNGAWALLYEFLKTMEREIGHIIGRVEP